MKALLAIGAIVLLAAAVWIGRASQEPELPAPQANLMGNVSKGVFVAPSAPVSVKPAPSISAVPHDIAADLRDPSPKVRGLALRDAAKSGAGAEVFLEAARDRDVGVGMAAVEELGKLHASGEVSAQVMLAHATDRSLNERVRAAALNGVGLVPSTDAARAFAELITRGDTLERRSAAILLVHQDREVAVPALIGALADADDVVRSNAAEALRGLSRGRDFGSDAAAWRAWWGSRSR